MFPRITRQIEEIYGYQLGKLADRSFISKYSRKKSNNVIEYSGGPTVAKTIISRQNKYNTTLNSKYGITTVRNDIYRDNINKKY